MSYKNLIDKFNGVFIIFEDKINKLFLKCFSCIAYNTQNKSDYSIKRETLPSSTASSIMLSS